MTKVPKKVSGQRPFTLLSLLCSNGTEILFNGSELIPPELQTTKFAAMGSL